MAEVEDVASGIELDSHDAPTIDPHGAVSEIPIYGSARDLSSDLMGTGQSVAGLLHGGENEPGVAEVAAEAGELVTDTGSFVAECANTASSMITSPGTWLASNGLDFLLEYITPLQDMLNQVTGDAAALERAAGNFTSIGEGLQAMSTNFVDVADSSLAEWAGDGADRARERLAEFADGISGIAAHSGNVADILRSSAMMMEAVETAVKSLISELVGNLIEIWLPALAASVVSFGTSVAAAKGVTAARVATTSTRVGRLVNRLMGLLRKLANFFNRISGTLKRGGGVLGKALGGERGQKIGEIGGKAFGKAFIDGAGEYVQQRTGIDVGALTDTTDENKSTFGNFLDAGSTFADHHLPDSESSGSTIPDEVPSDAEVRRDLDY
ncbi:hypothetical protein [Haloechinothrix sp. LS1_15]|uniref:WXG100 family type VII secretion target n=1 Tax=Haloechinothrix sp. LS1_15 TaxID=2652248 RepID=UPI00294725C1|nr:hypothetical protein [Haloechinothrix sp. LS1_15]MDV6013138.1 hypothetical protein [Haloechinothrix sp. LS1_15]